MAGICSFSVQTFMNPSFSPAIPCPLLCPRHLNLAHKRLLSHSPAKEIEYFLVCRIKRDDWGSLIPPYRDCQLIIIPLIFGRNPIPTLSVTRCLYFWCFLKRFSLVFFRRYQHFSFCSAQSSVHLPPSRNWRSFVCYCFLSHSVSLWVYTFKNNYFALILAEFLGKVDLNEYVQPTVFT